MTEKTYNQEFSGYWRDIHKGGIPAEAGIYCVYECTNNPTNKNISIHKLIYIGESDNVRERIDNHEKRPLWLKHVRYGNELCYNFTPNSTSDRERVEAAFIYEHQPPVNVEHKSRFAYDTTHVTCSGRNALLKTFFTVHKTLSESFSRIFNL